MLAAKNDNIFSTEGKAQFVIPRADQALLECMADFAAALFKAKKWALAVDVASRCVSGLIPLSLPSLSRPSPLPLPLPFPSFSPSSPLPLASLRLAS